MKLRLIAILSVILGMAAGTPSFAQVLGNNLKFFVGYSNLQAEGLANKNTDLPDVLNTSFFQDRTTLHGGNAELTIALKGIGITGDASFDRKHKGTDATGAHDFNNTDVSYFMAGPSFAYTGHSSVEPFARVMAGVAHSRFEIGHTDTSTATTLSITDASTNFALGIGGGLDVRLGEGPYRLRLIQVDYVPVFLSDKVVSFSDAFGAIQQTSLHKQHLNNVRLSFGFVF